MSKYYLRYLATCLPAVLVSFFYNNHTLPSQVLLWFTAFFMLFAWSVNTAMAAYHYPRGALSTLLLYGGLHTLILTEIYSTGFRDPIHIALRRYGGFLSFQPLDILVQTLKPIPTANLPWEGVVVAFLLACCLLGYIVGLVQRRVNPNPYRPRITRARRP